MLGLDKITFDFNHGWLVPVIISLLIYLALAIMLYRRTNPPFSGKIRTTLGIIRYLALFFIIFSLAEPVLSVSVGKEDKPIVIFLADNSRSLLTVEYFDQKSEFLRDFNSGKYQHLFPDDVQIEYYLFSDTLMASENPDFTGMQTSIGNVLGDIKELYKDRNLGAIVMASDGLSNIGPDPIGAARESGVPFYGVDLGPQMISRDIRIVDIDHEPLAYAGKPFEINVEIEGRGFERLNLPLMISSGGKEVTRRNIDVLGQGQRQRITLEITAQETGTRNFTVKLPVQPDEELQDNNTRNFRLKILKAKQRILLTTYRLNWEATFLHRALASSPDYELDLAVIDGRAALGVKAFPSSRDSLQAYDLIILVNCPNQFISSQLAQLNAYVADRGGSLWYLLGDQSTGSYAGEGAGAALPFVQRNDNRYFNDFAYHLLLTEEGRIHPVARIVEDSRENTKIWESLPPLEEVMALPELKPGSHILAIHPEKEARGNPAPIIYYLKTGKGKILTFAGGPWWKMGIVSAGYGGEVSIYRQLIMNSVRWLTTQEDFERIRFAPSQTIYRSGEKVELAATVLDDNYLALENSAVNVVVHSDIRPDSLIVSLVQDSPGKFSASLGYLPAGEYKLSGAVVWENRILKEIKDEFKVESFSLEEETLFLPADMMSRISLATGGKCYTINDFENIAGDLKAGHRLRSERYESRFSDNLWVLLLILALLSLEWVIRKRLQLL